METVKAWLLFIHIYAGPTDAIDHDGPWKYATTPSPRVHESLEACREEGYPSQRTCQILALKPPLVGDVTK